MTFTEIVTAVQNDLNLTSSASTTRVGQWVNRGYKRLASDFGIRTIEEQLGVVANTVVGNRNMLWDATTTTPTVGVEKILALYDTTVTPYRPIIEVSVDELRNSVISTDPVQRYAVLSMGSAGVVLFLDCIPATIYPLTADILANLATLSGSQVPAFTEDYHDLLVYYGKWMEAMKMASGNPAMLPMAKEYERQYHGADGQGGRLADYRHYIALSNHKKFYAGKTQEQGSIISARI
jgi:hypothetical protein